MTDPEADDDEAIPFASPEIREAYEAALGRFMLAFNEMDNLITDLEQHCRPPSRCTRFCIRLLEAVPEAVRRRGKSPNSMA
jgi:hypothetical protein